MKRLLESIVHHPAVAILILGIFITPFVFHLGELKIDASSEGLMASGGRAFAEYAEFTEIFGSDTLTAVVLREQDIGLFTENGLSAIQSLSDALFEIEGVKSVTSLTTVQTISGEGGFVSTGLLIEDVPADGDELEAIRKKALADPIIVGALVSEDGKTAAINIVTDPEAGDLDFDQRFTQEVDLLIDEYAGGFAAFQIGTPYSTSYFSSNIRRDQMILVPISASLLLIFLFVAFRSIVAVVVPMVTGGLSIATTLGFMAWMGYPVSIVTALVPAILIAVGCTEDVHMISLYSKKLGEGCSSFDAVLYMAGHSALPITLTSFTTIVGFATLSINKITVLKHFGIVSSFGLLANFLVTIVVLPVMLLILPVPRGLKTRSFDGLVRGLTTLATATMSSRKLVMIVSLVFVVLAVIGGSLVEVDTDFMGFFKEDSEIRKRVRSINEDLAGAHTLNIMISTGEGGGIQNPKVIEQIDRLQQFIASFPGFSKSVSIVDYIKLLHQNLDPSGNDIPQSEAAIAQYLLLLADEEITTYVDNEVATANIVVWNTIESSKELGNALETLRDFVDANLSKDLDIRFTGEWVVVNGSADSMVSGQVQSLGLALIAVFVIMTVLFMSVKAGLVAMIANTIPIALNFGVMGWFNIPLNTGTCMVAAIALGIAVDDTIHFMVRYQRFLRETESQELAMKKTLNEESEPIFLTSVALTLGFGALVMSSFNPTQHFGVLAALVMIYALVTDLFVNPAILLSVQLITLWDFLQLKLQRDITRDSPIFKGLSQSEAKRIVLLGSVRTVDAGDAILRQGEEGHAMYMLLTGSARVSVETDGRSVDISTVRHGDLLGEMALVGSGTRSANVFAIEKSDLLRIDDASLDKIRRRFPKIAARLFMNIASVLGERLRIQNLAAVDSRLIVD